MWFYVNLWFFSFTEVFNIGYSSKSNRNEASGLPFIGVKESSENIPIFKVWKSEDFREG